MTLTDVVFDLDDTLCDFSGARQRGLRRALGLIDAPDPGSDAERLWWTIDPALFAVFASGAIPIVTYRRLRFELVARIARPDVDLGGGAVVDAMNAAFMEEVNDRIELAAGAVECLSTLRAGGLRCHLLTNGPADGQRRKLERLGLSAHLDEVLIGEEINAFKPDPRAFAHVLQVTGRRPESTVMVGDSLADDIIPARAAGLETILLGSDPSHDGTAAADLTEVPHAIALLQQHQRP